MATLIGALLDIRNESPVPKASRRTLSAGRTGGLARSGKADELEAVKAISTLDKVIRKRAASVAQTEWVLYRTRARSRRTASTETDDREPVDSHLALDVWRNPNPYTTQTNFIKRWSMHLDLTAEAYILPTTRNGLGTAPVELWTAQPDRMTPSPHPTEFRVGWHYRTPDGNQIPLGEDEVWAFQDPDPSDEYRGLSPIRALMIDIDSARHGAEWNRNFFLNSAEPGGIIEATEGLTDDQFEDLARRWNEQHQGTRNAHRVAVIEHGKWVDRAHTMRDMQFEQLRNLSRDIIREAYAMSKVLLGIGESVNRATAEAAWAIYLEQEIKERLVELRRWLNADYLPRFGRTANGLEFDFVDPVPLDNEAANAELVAKATAAATLRGAGWDADAVLQTVGLPAMEHSSGEDIATDPAELAALIQKMYLGTPERAVVSQEEARDILRNAGAVLDAEAPGPAVQPVSGQVNQRDPDE